MSKTYQALPDQQPCPECESSQQVNNCPPPLATDCIVVDSLLCSKNVQKVAELTIPAATLGDIIDIGPGGTISPLITLTPDLSGIVSQITVVRGTVINTGFLPANITILGIPTPLQINLPFQQETECPGVCAEDNVTESPYKIDAVVTQGIEALGIGDASVLFKVILSTNLTATRQVVVKDPDLQLVSDINPDRCERVGQ